MDFEFSAEDEAYRRAVRQWLADHHPGNYPGPHGSPEWLQWAKDWQRQAYDAGYLGQGWPAEYGGVDATLTQQVVLTQEMVRACTPPFVGHEHMFTLGLIIGGGASQIQKNIIAERALGLPK